MIIQTEGIILTFQRWSFGETRIFQWLLVSIKNNNIHHETLENLVGNLTNKVLVLEILTTMNHHSVEYLEHQTRPEDGHNGRPLSFIMNIFIR